MTSKQLAALDMDLDAVEGALKDLRREGQVYRFETDDAYTWCPGNVSGGERAAYVERILAERRLTRSEIIAAIGHPPGDTREHSKAMKDADNTVNFLRMQLPVHLVANVSGDNVYWLARKSDGTCALPGAMQDGRMKKPDRSRAAARARRE